ncbi:tetratricopeptide repeat protein [Novosphingobium sp. SL115]|uniref:tetratricopeptide repeat protein n=1 Tax=Novosphingobium sp. SL115 TaxID=2995150 RepID=UPI0022745B91|nr:tetratricopeptide repeat protein [Novosphingobium sp. SL115]MCY1670694.1 tetratricopeptide repeat protein [Novosphingobium sp. SL115]
MTESQPATPPDLRAPAPGGSRVGRIALVAAGAIALGAGALAMMRGEDAAPPQAQPPAVAPSQQPSVDDVVARLEAKLAENPEDAEGWRMLGWSYFQTERYAEAATALKKATKLDPEHADTWSFLGEALVLASKEEGRMPRDAKAAFDKAIRLDPKDARARYFQAVALDLSGRPRQAINAWFALLEDTPADAPYAEDVREVIRSVGEKRKIEVEERLAQAHFAAPANGVITDGPHKAAAGIPGPTSEEMKAAASLPKGQQEAMIRGMVDGLEAKLEKEPGNADRWIMLMRSRMQLGEPKKAAEALQKGLAAFRNDSASARKLREAASSLGITGA